jgi:hypothetical protein
MADQNARQWELDALLRARMEKVQTREELVRFLVQQSLEDVVETMATEAETRSKRVGDVSILHPHAHRCTIGVPATAALECRNAC